MLTTDDLARAAEMVVGRVSPEADEPDAPCPSSHLDIARAGVEEGLKLALRLLRHEHGVAAASTVAGARDGQHDSVLAATIEASEPPGRR